MKPYKCPICDGHGIVPGGFYNSTVGGVCISSTNTTEKCRSCLGSGIIWGYDNDYLKQSNNESNNGNKNYDKEEHLWNY